jgi:hypothetical protein
MYSTLHILNLLDWTHTQIMWTSSKRVSEENKFTWCSNYQNDIFDAETPNMWLLGQTRLWNKTENCVTAKFQRAQVAQYIHMMSLGYQTRQTCQAKILISEFHGFEYEFEFI